MTDEQSLWAALDTTDDWDEIKMILAALADSLEETDRDPSASRFISDNIDEVKARYELKSFGLVYRWKYDGTDGPQLTRAIFVSRREAFESMIKLVGQELKKETE
jgi:hypothetical protein